MCGGGFVSKIFLTELHTKHYPRLAHNESDKYKLNVRLRIELSGVWIEIDGSGTFLGYIKERVKSNQTFETLDVLKYFEDKILPRFLFGAGLIRRIQLFYNCDKKTALERYKDVKKSAFKSDEFTDVQKALARRISKKLNLVNFYIRERDALNLLRTEKRRKVKTPCAPFPSPFAIMDGYDGDIDGIFGQMEEYISENYKSETYFF